MKRSSSSHLAVSSRPLPKRAKPRSGPMYLYGQLCKIMNSEILAEADESNITEWTVGITADMLRKRGLCQLSTQLKYWGNITQRRPVIVLNIKFPVSYPDDVPFVRIVRPRFAYRTGHVTIGGSICTDMLTPAGWRAMTVDALISSICEILRDGEAAVQMKPDMHCSMPFVDYSEQEAREAFKRVAEHHGWITTQSKGEAKRA